MQHHGVKVSIHAGILSGFPLEHHTHTQASHVLSGQCIYNFSIFPVLLIHWVPSASFVNRLNWHTNKENTVSQHPNRGDQWKRRTKATILKPLFTKAKYQRQRGWWNSGCKAESIQQLSSFAGFINGLARSRRREKHSLAFRQATLQHLCTSCSINHHSVSCSQQWSGYLHSPHINTPPSIM